MESNEKSVAIRQETAVAQHTPFLMTGALIRQKLAAQREMRDALIEYMHETMEHGKHYYYMSDFKKRDDDETENKGQAKARPIEEKPALTQDGARSLSTLFEVFPEASLIEEFPLPDGHVRIRITVVLKNYDGRICGHGIATCSTLESRYAYRWVFDDQVPRHLDKGHLPSRKTRGNRYTLYRVPNEDIEDQMNTVTKMSFKRAHIMAVQSLPSVSDAFDVSETEEDDEKRDDTPAALERRATLDAIKEQFRSVPRSGRAEVAHVLFGVTSLEGIAGLTIEALRSGQGRLRQLLEANHDWEHGDLKTTEQQHATKSRADLFGDEAARTPGQQAMKQSQAKQTKESASPPPTSSAPPDALPITENARLQDLIQRAQRLVNQAHNAIQGEDLLAPHIVDLEAEIATGVSMLRDDTVSDDLLATCYAQIETLMQQGIVGSMQGEQG